MNNSQQATFADVKQGDHVRLFNAARVEWSLPTMKIDGVKEGAVMCRGAWYFESDNWDIELVVDYNLCRFA